MNATFALATLVLSPAALAQAPDFGRFVPATEGVSSADRVRSFDVDLDGDLDLVLTKSRGSDVLWIEVLAPGQFAPPRVLVELEGTNTAPAGALDTAFLDLAGNGGDLFVSQQRQGRILRFPRTGQATFGSPSTVIQATGRANSILALDFDGDGDDDLLLAANFGTRGTWILENVNGTLASPVRLGEGGRLIEATDFEQDGDVDLFVATNGGGLWALRNDGLVAALPSELVGFSNTTFDLVAADFNADGWADVAFSGQTSNGVRVYLGDGAGAFDLAQTISYTQHHPSDARIEVLDIDGDSDADILIAPRNDARVDWIENLGNGAFATASIDRLSAAKPTNFFSAADLDSDGAPDLVSLDLEGAVQVGLTASMGVAGDLVEVTRRWEEILDAFPIDADSDGDLDVAVVSLQNGIGIARNDGTGTLSHPIGVPAADQPELGIAVDLDGDGREDLLYRSVLGQLLVSRQLATGFAAPVFVGDSNECNPVAVDLDLDGDLDVVTHRSGPDRLVAYLQQPDGSFSGEAPVVGLLDRPIDFALRHMDSDGVLDIVTYELTPSGMGSNRFYVYFGAAAGGFEPRVTLPLPQFPSILDLPLFEDFDGDGNVDVVYRSGTGADTAVWWTQNLGARQFASAAVAGVIGDFITGLALGEPVPGGPCALVVATTFGGLHRYRVFEVTPSGSLGAFEQVDSFTSSATAMFLADLGTGALDLVVADRDFDELVVSYNADWRDLGASYCGSAVPNSTGSPGLLTAFGDLDVSGNQFDLVASQLPPGSLIYFLASLDPGFVAGPAGSAGNLCLAGSIGRLNQSGFVGAANGAGVFRRSIDLTAIPQPMGAVSVLPQSTWYFQGWHRDVGPTSNFTTGLEVTFD